MAGAVLPGYGFEEAVGFAKESSWANSTAPTDWVRPIRCTIIPKDPLLKIDGVSGTVVPLVWQSASKIRGYRGFVDVSGQLVVEADYDDLGHWLLATAAFFLTTNNSPVSGAHAHTWALLPTVPTNNRQSYTIQRQGGTVWDAGSNVALRMPGCVCDSLEIAAAGGKIVSVTMMWYGRGDFTLTTAGTVVLNTSPWVEFHDTVVRWETAVGGTISAADDQTGENAAIDWKLTIPMNLRTDLQATGVAGRWRREPIPQGYIPPRFSFSRDFFNERFYSKRFPGETSPGNAASMWEVFCESDEFITGSTPFSLKATMPCGFIMSGLPEFGGGPDVLPETIEVEAGYDGSSSPLTIVLTNGTSAY